MVSYSFEGNKRFWTARDEEENEKIFSQQSKPTGIKIPNEIKPTYLAHADHYVEKWPLTDLMRLLRLYAAHRCLWDVSCKDNRNRKMRHAALVDITAALDTGVTKEQVVQKINILRATYRYEKKRVKQRIRRGLGAHTKLKWFALADAFLRNIPKKGQKEEDPSNSDSDLEDTIVFTINPESLVPLEQDFSMGDYERFSETGKSVLSPKQEIFSDDSQSWKTEPALNFNIQSNEDLDIKQEDSIEINDECQQLLVNDLDKRESSRPSWSLEDIFKFLKLLNDHSVLFDNSLESCELHEAALEIIAQEMQFNFKSIEKRWQILKKTYEQEKQLMAKKPDYKPPFKWWLEAEKLFDCHFKKEQNKTPVSKQEKATEAIFLPDNEENTESTFDEDYEYRFLQNPIPSVAPLSNMSEAIAALFHNNEGDEEFSQESNTNSSFAKDNDSKRSVKYVWQGLEDDLLEGKWSLKHSVKFLRLYGFHKCLWDLNDPDYRSRPLRNAAIEDIAASMGHGLTASYVAKKIKIFRITYMQQRKRLLEATEKGEKPEILLKWFPLADSFLRPHIGLRSIKSDAKEMPQFDYQYVYANLNLIDPALLTDFRGKGTQNAIEIGNERDVADMEGEEG